MDNYGQVINLDTSAKEMKAFIGVNYVMAINQLSSIPMYWDHFIGNVVIQNIFTRTRYQEVLQNLHFADNTKQDKTNNDYNITPIIYHLNELFQVVFSNKYGKVLTNIC